MPDKAYAILPLKKIRDLKTINGILINLFIAAYRLDRVLYKYPEDSLFNLVSVTNNAEHSDLNDNFKN